MKNRCNYIRENQKICKNYIYNEAQEKCYIHNVNYDKMTMYVCISFTLLLLILLYL
jgi:hypothetical protein